MIEERKRLGEKLTKGAGAKVAPSLGATDIGLHSKLLTSQTRLRRASSLEGQ
jgi:hypothetical protein